jgi:hypothetical protein
MAAPKKAAAKKGKVSEYGGMEKYPSKKAMMAHEKKEGKGAESAEKKAFMAMLTKKKKK